MRTYLLLAPLFVLGFGSFTTSPKASVVRVSTAHIASVPQRYSIDELSATSTCVSCDVCLSDWTQHYALPDADGPRANPHSVCISFGGYFICDGHPLCGTNSPLSGKGGFEELVWGVLNGVPDALEKFETTYPGHLHLNEAWGVVEVIACLQDTTHPIFASFDAELAPALVERLMDQ